MKKKKDGFWTRIKNRYVKIRQYYRSNITVYRAISITIASIITLGSIVYGFNHKHDVQYKRAMTLSDVNQELSFSKTGVDAQLREQKRYKDMTIIPIKINAGDRQSFNASDYLVAIMPLKKHTTKEELEKTVSANFVFFGSSGESAIVLKGDLPKEPIQIILKNDSNFSPRNDGSGEIQIDGKSQEIDYNAISFTVNPKGNNVKKDSKISSDMKMSDLYLSSIGDKQFKKIATENKASIEEEKRLRKQKNEFESRIKQMNKALNRDENDLTPDESSSSDSSTTSSVTADDLKEFEDTDMDSSDVESLRNGAIAKLEVINQDIETQIQDQDALEKQSNELINYTKNVYDLVSISNKFEILNKE